MTRELARESARIVATYLKDKHGATRVLLFGSSVHGPFQQEHSDIDLYFEGIPYDKEFSVTGDTFCHFAKLNLDLIPAGHAPPDLKDEILSSGVVL